MLIVSKFQILLVCFVWKVSCLKQRFSQEFCFVTLKCRGMFRPKLKPAFQINPPKVGQFVLGCPKGYKFHHFLLSFVWEVSWLNQKTFTGVSFCDTEGPCKHWAKIECCFPNQPPKNWSIRFKLPEKVKISYLIAFFVWKVNDFNQTLSQEFCLVTLKGSGTLGPKLNAAFQIRQPKIGQLVWSGWIGSKFRILLLSFVGKVNYFHRSLILWHWRAMKHWLKQGQNWILLSKSTPPKNWSICFELSKMIQISYFIAFFCLKGKWLQPKTFTGVLFSETEGLWNVWVKTECCFPNQPPSPKKKNWPICFELPKRLQVSHFVAFFCLKGKLAESKNLHRSFILWQWRAMQTLIQNWMLLSKSTP